MACTGFSPPSRGRWLRSSQKGLLRPCATPRKSGRVLPGRPHPTASRPPSPQGGGRASHHSSAPPILGLRRQNLLHLRHEVGFGNSNLSRPRGAPFGVVGNLCRHPRALDEILDLHLAPGALVAALDDDD